MSLYAVHLANGRTSNTGAMRLMGRLLSGSGVLESTGFTVAAQSTPDMTVKVSGSTKDDNLVIVTATGDTYHGWNTTNSNVTITSNATGVTRKDHIVAYIDTALTTATPDNPGGLVLIAVKGSTTLAPTDGQIDTATGSKPWLRLAEISVANGASSINSGNITDLRVVIGIDGSKLTPATVPVGAIKSEAWTSYTPAWTGSSSNPSLGNGTLAGRYFKIGRMVTGFIELVIGSTTTNGSGDWLFSVPVPQYASPFPTAHAVGTIFAVDISAGNGYTGSVTLQSASAAPAYRDRFGGLFLNPTSTVSGQYQVLGPTLPFGAWATGDLLTLSFTYESAA